MQDDRTTAPALAKPCSACEIVKPLTEFHRRARSTDGLSAACKTCILTRSTAYRVSHRAELAQKQLTRYYANPAADLARRKAYRQAHLEQEKARQQAWYLENADRTIAKVKAWSEANPDRVKARSRAYYESNADQINAKQKAWREANPERNREMIRAWEQAHPEQVQAYRKKRKAIKRGATVADNVSYIAIAARDGMICGICKGPVDWPELSFDHIIPLSKRGPHVEWNIQVAHKVCNSRKGAKLKPGQLDLPI